MSISRVWLRWVCVSMITGITVLPAKFTCVAPAGARTSAALPTCANRAPFTMNDAFSIGGRASPTMTRAPSKTVTPVAGVCPKAATADAAMTVGARSFTRCTSPSTARTVSGIARHGASGFDLEQVAVRNPFSATVATAVCRPVAATTTFSVGTLRAMISNAFGPSGFSIGSSRHVSSSK